jgi:nondiscriminating glutamyl-tRNA synthetase
VSATSAVRVRFAPSPTGHLHVGNARTALFNWLFARHKGGSMILRIEDTDVDRSEARFEDQLLADLRWLDLDWDEGPDVGGNFGPYRQSDRLQIYREQAQRLLSEHRAYLCFCTEEDLQRDRERATAEHRQPIYSGKCRTIDPAEAQRRRAGGEACAVRLRIPGHPIRFHDIVHGEVEFSNEVVSDPIILRSSGMPVYNFVVVIDDALMKITHVIRGDDHLSNTPKQVALYEALGWPVPEFAHLSTILGADRERLSKRHGASSIANFRAMGVLPEALVNYLALLGWAPPGGTREIFSLQQLINEFSLERVTPSPAVFDMEKLYWLNRHYIQEKLAGMRAKVQFPESAKLPPDAVAILSKVLAHASAEDNSKPTGVIEKIAALPPGAQLLLLSCHWLSNAGWIPAKPEKAVLQWVVKLDEMLLPSVNRLDQLPERASFIFNYDAKTALVAPHNAEVLAWPHTHAVLARFTFKILENEWAREGRLTSEQFKKMVNEVQAETGTKGKELFHPIRIAITGSHSGPEFDKVIPLLEEGSQLSLPRHVKSVHQRMEEFAKAMK